MAIKTLLSIWNNALGDPGANDAVAGQGGGVESGALDSDIALGALGSVIGTHFCRLNDGLV